MQTVSIVVPSYNERDNVRSLTEQVDAALAGIPHEIIFVDDSTDDTPAVLSALSAQYPHVHYEHRTNEKGLATAVIRGFRLAQGDYLAVMDADLQHPPTILRPMFAVMESGADFCIPSRLIPGGDDGGLNWYRKFVSGTARYIGKVLLPCLRRVSDPTSGLFMFRKEVIANADLQPIGWKIMVEVLAMATYQSIVEIPYAFQQRTAGESKLDSKVTVQYLKQCVGLMHRAVRNPSVTVSRLSAEETAKLVEQYCPAE